MSVAQANDKGCSVKAPGIVKGSEDKITDKRDDDAAGGILCDTTFTQPSSSYQSARDKSYAKQCEEKSCACCDAEFLLRIDGNISAHHTIRETVTDYAKCFGPAFQQEEAVETK